VSVPPAGERARTAVPPQALPAEALPADALPAGEFDRRDLVELRLPADSAYLAVVRTATAGLAARLDFTLDEIEDLRIAVDEGCTVLLRQASPGADLVATFAPGDAALTVQLAVLTTQARLPDRDSLAWQVLTALAGELDAGTTPGPDGQSHIWLRLHKRREQQ